MQKKEKTGSIRIQIVLVLAVIWLLLFGLITAYSRITQNTLLSEIRVTNENMLNLYSAQLDTICTEVNRYIANIQTIYAEKSGIDQMTQSLASAVLLYGDSFSFWLYDEDASGASLFTASNVAFSETGQIRELLGRLPLSPQSMEWCLLEDGNGDQYIVRYYQQENRCVGAWISLKNALSLYQENQFAKGSVLYFSDADGNMLTGTPEQIDPENQMNRREYLDRNYLHLAKPVVNDSLYLSLMIPYDVIFSSFTFIVIAQWFMIGVFVLGFLLLFFYINQLIFRPLLVLEKAMNEVRAGNYKISLQEDGQAKEFRAVNAAFNSMVREIDYLKVSIYEREIYNQKLELEKMQLQVKPHFYLNCLNIIFNLAQGGEFALIQELCMAQIRYFRYMMKSSFTTVSIREEFDHIRNYMHIQQLRYPGRYDIELDLNSELEDVEIPPLILHVFAENLIKHVATPGKIRFSIAVSECAEGRIRIQIEDNGPGFPEEVLQTLQKGELIPDEEGNHIGINNTMKRLKLYYQDQCSIRFGNQKPHGARIVMILPKEFHAEQNKEGGPEHESASD